MNKKSKKPTPEQFEKEGIEVTLIPNEDSITFDRPWWEKNAEIEHKRILGALSTGSFPVCLREIHSYLEFLREEYEFIDNLLADILGQLQNDKEREQFLEAWNLLLQCPN